MRDIIPRRFFTLTDQDTQYTNSRSQRFNTFEEAKQEAEARIKRDRNEGVYILQAVALVRRSTPPIETINL